jgi:4-amino-4-deoxy-L-arabinose transferase-like glycosyltransferase
MPLTLILVVAMATRVVWVRSLTGAINWETVPYTRIAQSLVAGKGYVGLVAERMDLMYPPLFSLLIVVASRVLHDWQLAAQSVSVIMGALLTLPVFFICRLLYDDKVARVGALLVGLHPLLLHVSAQGLSEGPYLALLMAGIYYSMRAIELPMRKTLLLAGLFFGLAYLTRPEAFIYPFLATVLVMVSARRPTGQTVLHAGLLLTFFLIVATPYIVFLSLQTGYLCVEAKSPMIHFLNQGNAKGNSPFEVDEGLNERGGWMRSRRSVIKDPDARFALGLKYGVGAAKHNLSVIVDALGSSRSLGSPVLFALAVIGFFRKDWTRELTKYQALLVSIVVFTTLALLWKATNFRPRYYSAFLPSLLVWAAKGVTELAHWTRSMFSMFTRRSVVSERAADVVQWASVGALLLLASLGVSQLWDFAAFGSESKVFIEMGAWLKNAGPEAKTVMDTTQSIAFHADASFVPFPECASAVALRYLDKKGVNFIVLRTAPVKGRRYLQDWLQHGIPDRRAELVYSRETAMFGKVLIYKWKPS